MQQFSQMYGARPVFSVEIFPPKTEKGEANLYRELERLAPHEPAFVSCTYGAGGSTRAKTLELVRGIHERLGLITVPHFTSVGATRNNVRAFVSEALAIGARNVVALRGDPPHDQPNYTPPADGFRYGNELVGFIRECTDLLELAVAGYPEGHVECRELKQDVQYLRRKVEAGAAVVLTQLFYDNADFFRFRDECARAGINVPLVPGIMPITKFSQIQRITSLCGARIPDSLTRGLAPHADGSDEQQRAGIDYAIAQCDELLQQGAPGLHIFSLNSGHATAHIVEALSDRLRAAPPASPT